MIPLPLLDAAIGRALEEDLHGGDLTSEAIFDESNVAIADVIAKAPLVLSGAQVFARTFHLVTPGVRLEQFVTEGTFVGAGTLLFQVEGRTKGLLMAERTALNFLQHMSGIATLTREFVEKAKGRARIADTRKTLPGLRLFEKIAVRHGGGINHRNDLGSAVLIKDNHIAAAGSIEKAIERARASAPHTSRIEIEVESLEGVERALAAGADIIMLDNFADDAYAPAVALAKGRAILEVSGGITLERVEFLASLGIDVLSVGALTHSAKAADISLRVKLGSE